MLTLRTFRITLHGAPQGIVDFVGPEYDIKSVKKFLVDNDKMSREIEVKLIKEIQK